MGDRRAFGALIPTLALMVLLVGCSLIGFGESYPQPLPTRAGYSGSDGAFLHVRAVTIANDYMEGSLQFARLNGPTAMTWQVNPWSSEDGPIGIQRGSYSISFWQRPCDGSCEYLDPEVSRCSASFEVEPAAEVLVEARFPMHVQCSVTVTSQ